MRIMTFNTQHCLNYLEQKIDFDVMARAIKECGADVVGLNEMRDAGTFEGYTAQTEALSQKTGLRHFFFAKAIDFLPEGGAPYGNGLLSALPILNAQAVPIPDPDPKTGNDYYETRCLLKATLQGGLTVLVTHFGLNLDEQQSAVDTVLKHITPEKCVLMGDFNVRPESPLLAPIRARMKDTAAAFSSPRLSFPSDAPDRKIDYIFVSPDIEVVSADIPAIVASDHRPHTAEIVFLSTEIFEGTSKNSPSIAINIKI